MKLRFVFYGACLVFLLICLYLSFTHIDMTETRLFITYWPIYVTGIGTVFLLFLLSIMDEDK